MNKVVKTLLFLLLLICFGCEEKPPYKIPKYPEIEQDIYFEGDYPPVVEVTYEENGHSYQVDAVQGQVMVVFEETVSHESALKILKNNQAKIVAQLPKIHYYLVEVPMGKEGEFIFCMRKLPEVDYVYPNAIEEICSVDSYVLDNFNGNHGQKVVDMMKGCYPLMNVKSYNIGTEDGRGIFSNRKEEVTESILYSMGNDESVVINMSFGPKFTSLESYINDYINEIIQLVKIAKRFDNKDFVVVKSSGNDGVKNLEYVVKLLKSKLSSEEQDILDRHFLLVSAKDDNKQRDYPNDVTSGYYEKMVTKVDISDMTEQDFHWQGTSFSSPRVAGFVITAADAHNLKVTEVLKYARTATEKASDHILTSELLEKVIEDNMGTMPKVTIEGVLRMYLLNSSGGGSVTYYADAEGNVINAIGEEDLDNPYCQIIYEYRETDFDDTYLVFVVETDKAIDVNPYIEDAIVWEGLLPNQSAFELSLSQELGFSGRDFASKYANKRVRASGTLYAVVAGWRHATAVGMYLDEIKLLETVSTTAYSDEQNTRTAQPPRFSEYAIRKP